MTNAYSVSPQQIVSDAERFLRARYHVDFANAHDFQLHDAIAQAVMLSIAPKWAQDEQELRQRRRAEYPPERLWSVLSLWPVQAVL